MKRIILGLSVLLMLAQNGFARSNADYDRLINGVKQLWWKQNIRCDRASANYPKTGDIKICIKAIKMLEKSSDEKAKRFLGSIISNTGVMAYYQGDKFAAYKYWIKASRIGYVKAQSKLDILCSESPWACK